TVVVNEVNGAPVLLSLADRTTAGVGTVVVTNTATDADIPTNALNYVLVAGPAAAIIDTNGVITWTPAVADVPSTHIITTVVTDSNTADSINPHLSATNSFTLVVNILHNGPVLSAQPNRTVNEQSLLTVTNAATDVDVPIRIVSYSLLNPPAGASINP